jgi:dTDP-4-amino-4,6-dideoxygalactose transaminase
MYPDSINNISEIKDRFKETSYGNAEWIAKSLVTLPTHVFTGEHDKARICEAVMDCLRDDG